MKKILFSLLTLAAALTVTSCLKDVEGAAAYDDGTLVDATFSVNLGSQTKAFADGTTADVLYAGIYQIDNASSPTTFTHVAHTTEPISISDKAATVTFEGKIQRGKLYRVVFWAQKSGVTFYTIDWAATTTAGPTVLVNQSGNANDETRDAFYGQYTTQEAVTGPIDLTGSPVNLTRPFAQVNVLVPDTNVDPYTTCSSSMKIIGAPNELNLASKSVSGAVTYFFNFAAFSSEELSIRAGHKYMAMNYVLVPQDNEGGQYTTQIRVVTDAPQSTGDENHPKEVVNLPLKANVRTNIIGDIFNDDFDITIPISITPTPGTQDIIEVEVEVTNGSAQNPAQIDGETHISLGLPYTPKQTDDPIEISFNRDDVVTATWDYDNNYLVVTPKPGVVNGSAVITLVFPSVTRATYGGTTVDIHVKVGNGEIKTLDDIDITTEPTTKTFTVGQAFVFDGVVTATYLNADPATEEIPAANLVFKALLNDNITFVLGEAIPAAAVGVTAIAVSYTYGGVIASDIIEGVTISAAPVETVATPTFSPASGSAVEAGSTVTITTTTEGASISYKIGEGEYQAYTTPIEINEAVTITAKATKSGMTDSAEATASYTISAPVVTTKTVTEIIGLDDNATFSAGESLVVAKCTRGVIVSDGTNSILVYNWDNNASSTSALEIGDKITFDGTKSSYNGVPQVNPVSNISVKSHNNPVSYPTATNITSTFDSYTGTKADFITFSGVLSVSGTYYNILVEGATTHQGSIYCPLDASELINGRPVTVKGYYNGLSSSKYVNIIVTDVEILPYLTATPATKTVNANETSVTWTISSNKTWTISGDGITASPSSGTGDGTEVTLSFAANETTTAKTLTATAKADGCEDVNITITQNGTGTTTNPRYVKITSTSELTDGNYLIVYETGSIAFNGGLETLDAVSNTISVTISEGVIAQSATVDAAVFTYNSTDKTLKSASGLYIGKTATGNGLNTSATNKYTNTITFDSGDAVITSSGGPVLKYNDASNQTRFRYFGSGQKSIQLYKYTE